MTTYQQAGQNKFDIPAGVVGEKPDVVGDLLRFATQVDARLGAGGAEACANLAAINALPTSRCFPGKRAYAINTGLTYVYTSGSWVSTRAVTTGHGTTATGFTGVQFDLAYRNGQVDMVFAATRNAGTITGTGSGNITNIKVGNVGAWIPVISPIPLASGASGPTCSFIVDGSGDVYLCAMPPSYNLTNGQTISCGGSWITNA